MKDSKFWVETLGLLPHPEGGYYRETYRSRSTIPQAALAAGFTGDRLVSTAIYFLLEAGNFSAFHRIRSDEMWHFYDGFPIGIHMISPEGEYRLMKIGNNPEASASFQGVVVAGWWFAAEVLDNQPYSLVGCTVAPGFDFADFEMAERDSLIAAFPQHSAIIERLTRS